jgi:hypothetical protein
MLAGRKSADRLDQEAVRAEYALSEVEGRALEGKERLKKKEFDQKERRRAAAAKRAAGAEASSHMAE